MGYIRRIAPFICALSLIALHASYASSSKDNAYSLKIRTGKHPRYMRVVLEGQEALISKGKVSHDGGDIVVSFTGTGFVVEKSSPQIKYRMDRDSIVFPQSESSKVKSFFLKNPDRLVVDIYKEGKATKKRAKKAAKAESDQKTEAVSNTKKEPKVTDEEAAKQVKNTTDETEKKEEVKASKSDPAERKYVPRKAQSDEMSDIEEHIPESLKQLWALLKSGKSFGLIKLLPSYKPEDDGALAAYHYMYGEAYRNLKKHHKAVDHYRLAYIYASHNTLKELSLIRRAEQYEKAKFYYEARADYLVFVRSFPSSPHLERAYLGLGNSIYEIGFYAEAIKYYEKAGESPEALYGLAKVLQRNERFEAARSVYDRALRVDRDYPVRSPETYYFMGENLRMLGNLKNAKKNLVSVEFGPYRDKAVISLGHIALEEGNIDEAIRKYQSATNSLHEKTKAEGLYHLALAYAGDKRYDDSISCLENIRNNHMDFDVYQDSLLMLARLYRIQGRIRDSLSMLKELVYGDQPPGESFDELEKIVVAASKKTESEEGEDIPFVDLWTEIGQWLVDDSREKLLVDITDKLRHQGEPFLKLCSWLVENGSAKAKATAAAEMAEYYAGIGNIVMTEKYLNIANVANAVNVREDFRILKERIVRVEGVVQHLKGDHEGAFEKIVLIENIEGRDLDQLGKIITAMHESGDNDVNKVIEFYERKLNESEWDGDLYLKFADILYTMDKQGYLKYYRIAYEKIPDDEWAAYRVGRGMSMSESKDMFGKLEKGDTLLGRLAKTRLQEMNLLNKVKEVY
jgi:tetratricopeptide (TPR) repeat protein